MSSNLELRLARISAAQGVVAALAGCSGIKTEALYLAAVELLKREFADGAPANDEQPPVRSESLEGAARRVYAAMRGSGANVAHSNAIARAVMWIDHSTADVDMRDYISSSPFVGDPLTSSHVYNGPIEPGMRFIWEPNGGRARCEVEVMSTSGTPGPDRQIWASKVRADGTFEERTWNDESRFREACVPKPQRS